MTIAGALVNSPTRGNDSCWIVTLQCRQELKAKSESPRVTGVSVFIVVKITAAIRE
jgi:hypothetical protein